MLMMQMFPVMEDHHGVSWLLILWIAGLTKFGPRLDCYCANMKSISSA